MTEEQERLKKHFLEPEVRDGVEVSVERKKAWKVMLDIFEEVIRICDKYHLEWSMDGGSLIGAMRHKGFVPWDDDIDIVLPRDHYETLLRVLPGELPKHLFMQTSETDPESFAAVTKIRDIRTTGIIPWHAENGFRFCMGLFVDILPLDAVPVEDFDKARLFYRSEWIKQVRRRRFWRKRRDSSRHGFFSWLKWSFFFAMLGSSRLYRIREMPFRRMNVRKSREWQVYPAQVGYVARCRRKAEWFRSYIEVPFEYLMVKVPIGYDDILTQNYGNWRKPSREGSFHGTLVFDAEKDWKTTLIEQFGYKEKHLRGF